MSGLNYYLLLFLLMTTACEETILHNLSETGANGVVLKLAESGLSAGKTKEGENWSVSVSSAEVQKALHALDRARVFRRLSKKSENFKTSIVSGREEKRAALESLRTSRLEETLSSFPGVLEARVHMFLEASSIRNFRAEPSNSSASVLLISNKPDKLRVKSIKQLVSGATGIQLERIAIVTESPANKLVHFKQSNFLADPQSWFLDKFLILSASLTAIGLLIVLTKIRTIRKRRLKKRKREASAERDDKGEDFNANKEEKLQPWEILVQ